ncbi:MAG: hypothetical protein EBX55_05420, partial [Betaproteobacteria bacterium]|nr:hypothetical protein [Betaproteobacteria bacterium]
GTDPRDPQLIEARVAPVAKLEIKNLANKVAASGETVYKAQCAGCHAVGAAGAPKIGDAVAWAPRIKTGFEALWQSSLKGKGAMGAQAGGDYDDQEIGNAVVYLANAAGAKFAELKPAPKAEGGAQADAVIARKQDDDENGYDKSQDNNGDKLARRLDKRAVLFALCIAHVSSARMTKTDIIMTW